MKGAIFNEQAKKRTGSRSRRAAQQQEQRQRERHAGAVVRLQENEDAKPYPSS